jgi:ribosomal protein S18 acetylase RimI-like enzyme
MIAKLSSAVGPDGGGPGVVTVRSARSSDVDAIVAIHVESTNEAYAPLAKTWPAADVEQRRAHWVEWLQEGRASGGQRVEVVAELDDEVVGFSSGGPARDGTPGAEVELYVIHVLPRCRGAGVGAALWSELCQRLRGPALRSMYVSTLAELRCCSFYERHGGRVASRRPRSFHGAERTEVIYFWPAGSAHLTG